MDPISQGVLGALAAGSFARRGEAKRGIAIGTLGGMAADLDILIRAADDPLLTIEFHRHFTHALVFIPVGALLVALFSWPLLGRALGFGRTYWFALLGYATSGLLDACTSYGTQLLWPFSDARVAWHIISIIDPIFTFTLLFLIAVAFFRNGPALCRVAAAFALAYLALGVVQNRRATAMLEDLAAARGHSAERLSVKPAIANLWLWRGLYIHGGRLYADAIRIPYWGTKSRIYEGESTPLVSAGAIGSPVPEGSALEKDLRRFDHFSDGYLGWHPDRPGLLGDLRYSTIPNEIAPLWGIAVDFSKPDQHAPFESVRQTDGATRQRLLAMLKGEDPPPP
ncbi:MAG: metal-dependent hydrolase [Verrucomicrobiales bacterium]